MAMKLTIAAAALMATALSLPGWSQEASQATIAANKAVKDYLPFEDDSDFKNATRGRIATIEAGAITGPTAVAGPGGIVYDLKMFDFLKGDAPATANPSLWRQSRLNAISGLFEVTPGIYQVRGFDLANMSFIRGKTGWIVIDPLTSTEAAAAGLKLLRESVADLPVSGLIVTHSHADHYSGVKAILTPEDMAQRGVPFIAPEGFFKEAISENLIAGNAMSRRAGYMYGTLLKKNATGTLGSGLGTTTSNGSFTIMKPTIEISETPTELTVDGIDMTFLNTPGAEAPAELMFYIHPFEAMMQAEIINHTMHNLYTLRGAKVRSGDLFAKYINDTINRFGDKVEVSFGSHHWPTWGNAEIIDFWEGQRDTYRYIHDEVLRLANKGETMLEIGEQIKLPDSLAKRFADRPYYGTLNHNAKAQYQLYYGFFSGNPAELHELPPAEEGAKFVEYAGGADAVIKKARTDYKSGEYRWVATALNHLVFADPENKEAKNLLADAYTQMGYQAESGPWRNCYLSGAEELRKGVVPFTGSATTISPDVVKSLPLPVYLDYLAVLMNHPKAAGRDITLNLVFPDIDERVLLAVTNGVMNYSMGLQSAKADATVTLDRSVFDAINLGRITLTDAGKNGSVIVEGNREKAQEFVSLLEPFDLWFNIVTP